MPSLESFKKIYLARKKLWPPIYEDGTPNEEWFAHSTSPEPYHPQRHQPFHICCINRKNVIELFGKTPDNIEDFIKQSQIFQAEAFKYVIEKISDIQMEKTGIIWWNLLNGWPQIDNGLVDYYFTKKACLQLCCCPLQPVCLIMEETDQIC